LRPGPSIRPVFGTALPASSALSETGLGAVSPHGTAASMALNILTASRDRRRTGAVVGAGRRRTSSVTSQEESAGDCGSGGGGAETGTGPRDGGELTLEEEDEEGPAAAVGNVSPPMKIAPATPRGSYGVRSTRILVPQATEDRKEASDSLSATAVTALALASATPLAPVSSPASSSSLSLSISSAPSQNNAGRRSDSAFNAAMRRGSRVVQQSENL
jgi:hypothetical protein